jgi:hypothetical protein
MALLKKPVLYNSARRCVLDGWVDTCYFVRRRESDRVMIGNYWLDPDPRFTTRLNSHSKN